MRTRLPIVGIAVGLILMLMLAGSVTAQRPPASLNGQVTHGLTDEPIAGVTVTLASAANRVDTIIAPFASDAIVRYTVETDSSGNYAFDEIPPGDYVIFADHDDLATLPAITLILEEEESQQVNFSMTPGGSIMGQVTNSDGSPAIGGVVSLFNMRLAIDATQIRSDGTFLFEHVEPGEQYQLFFQTTDEAKLSDNRLVVTEGEALIVDVEMNPAVQIAGYVTDDLGQPIERAVVSLEGSDLRWSGVTDEDGFYELGGAGAEYITIIPGDYDLRVRADHHTSIYEDEVDLTEPGFYEMGFALERAALVSGRVVDDRGFPIPNASVAALGPTGRQYTILTEDDGTYILDIDDPDQDYLIRAYVSEHIPQQTDAALNVEKGVIVDGVDFTLPRGTYFAGLVLGDDAPAANSIVDVYAPDGEVISLVTDFQGEFEYNGLLPGAYTVVIAEPTGAYSYVDTLQVGDRFDPFLIQMEATAEITGTATGASLVAVAFNEVVVATQAVDADGSFTLAGLAPGTYQVMIYRDGQPADAQEVTLSAGDSINLSETSQTTDQ